MSISVTCRCGHRFRAKDKYAGQRGRCPACGAAVEVPLSEDSGSERLRIARAMQQALLPRDAPQLSAFELAGISHAAEAPGGDYFDYFPFEDGSQGVVIGDASGRGLPAAMLMAEARVCLRSLAQTASDAGTIFTHANRVFSSIMPEDYYATLTLLRLDPNNRYLSYASAGHPTGYVLDASGQVKWTLESTDCPLGLLAQTRYGTSHPICLEPGELVVFITNGILKARNTAGAAFGVQNLLAAASGHRHESAHRLAQAVHNAVADFTQPAPPEDDRTVLVIKARQAVSSPASYR